MQQHLLLLLLWPLEVATTAAFIVKLHRGVSTAQLHAHGHRAVVSTDEAGCGGGLGWCLVHFCRFPAVVAAVVCVGIRPVFVHTHPVAADLEEAV